MRDEQMYYECISEIHLLGMFRPLLKFSRHSVAP